MRLIFFEDVSLNGSTNLLESVCFDDGEFFRFWLAFFSFYKGIVLGSKTYEGKNVFTPGVSPKLQFDVEGAGPDEVTETRIHVIAGGPCSGKTTLMRALEERGLRVEPETSERPLQSGRQAVVGAVIDSGYHRHQGHRRPPHCCCD